MAKTAEQPVAPKPPPQGKVKPSDRVHFVDRVTGVHHVAIVMAVKKGSSDPDLEVVPAGGTTFAEKACVHDEADKKPGTWHFIEG